jgi:hypothetical protein
VVMVEEATRRERREIDVGWKKKTGRKTWLLANFRLDFIHAQTMKSTSIYWRWKRDVLSLKVQNLSLGSTGNDLNRWFKVGTMNCQICQLKVAWVGFFRPVP